MEEDKILIQIDVDNDAAEQELVKTEKFLISLREQQTALTKAYKAGEVTQEEYAASLVKIKQSIAAGNNDRKALIKSLETEEGSLKALRNERTKLTQQRNQLNLSTKEGAEQSQKLNLRIKELTNSIREQEQAGGDFRDQVGQYGVAFNEASAATISYSDTVRNELTSISGVFGTFSGQAVDSANKIAVVGKSVTSLSKTFGVLRVAIASTGIGALVIALASLVTFFTKTQRGADLISNALAGFNAIVDVAIERGAKLGEALVNIFTAPQRAAQLFKESITGIADEVSREVAAAQRIEKGLRDIEDAEIGLIVAQESRLAVVAQLRNVGEDATKSEEARVNALKSAILVQNQFAENELRIQRERVALLQEQFDLGESSREDARELQQAYALIANIQRDQAERTKEIRNQINTINKTSEEAAFRAREEARKAREEAQKFAQEFSALDIEGKLLDVAKNTEEELRLRIQLEKRKAEIALIGLEQQSSQALAVEQKKQLAIQKLQKQFNDAQLAEKQKQQEALNRLEIAALQQRLALVEQGSQEELEIKLAIEQQRTNNELAKAQEDAIARQTIELQHQTAVDGIRQQYHEAEIARQEKRKQEKAANLQQQQQLEEQYTNAINQLGLGRYLYQRQLNEAETQEERAKALYQSQLAESRVQVAGQVAGQIANLFEENTIAYKAFASAEAVINALLASTKALASAPPPINFIAAGAALAAGLAAVAKINNVLPKKNGRQPTSISLPPPPPVPNIPRSSTSSVSIAQNAAVEQASQNLSGAAAYYAEQAGSTVSNSSNIGREVSAANAKTTQQPIYVRVTDIQHGLDRLVEVQQATTI